MSRVAFLASFLLVAGPSMSWAHISMLQPKERTDGFDDQKTRHCGTPGWSRAANPSRTATYKPGETIRVMYRETVGHPGWYRIAFQPNGEVFSYPPPGAGAGGFPTVDQTGMVDGATGTMILKDRIPDAPPNTTMMIDVTLPNIECNNCTLQFTQFMTDRATYTTDDRGAVYFRCADIVLTNTPQPMPDAGTPMDAGPDASPPAADGPATGGCSTGGGAGSLGSLLLAACALLLRRRR